MEGLAAVDKEGKLGYVDAEGNVVVTPQFKEANDFSEGLAAVQLGYKWGYIDKEGKFAVKPEFLMLGTLEKAWLWFNQEEK